MANESYDFGLFSAKPGEGAFGSKDVILFQRRPLSSGVHVFDFVVDRKPALGGRGPLQQAHRPQLGRQPDPGGALNPVIPGQGPQGP